MDDRSTENRTLPVSLLGPPTWRAPLAFAFLWDSLAQSSALIEGTKIFLIGSMLELGRRAIAVVLTIIVESFFMHVEFEDRDETFTWMMFWLSRQRRWNKLRNIRVSTFRYGQSGVSNLVPGEDGEAKIDPLRKVAYVPTHNEAITMWHRKTWMKVTLIQTQGDMWNRRGDERLRISLFARNQAKLDELLLEAKLSYKKHSEGRINVYVCDASNEWSLAGSRPRRPLGSVVLDKKIKKRLLADAKDFVASEKWYAARGIPWRRGYLLHGSPGSGKTSLIHSLAGELGLDVYVVALSKKSLDDSSLNELISKIPPKSLALIEDIDAAFFHGVNRETESLGVPLMPGQPPDVDVPSETGQGQSSFHAPVLSSNGITLSGLLGAIDGVAAQEGRLLFATTNKYSALDPALIRPGRLDVHVRFDNADKKQAGELFRSFFRPTLESDSDSELGENTDDEMLHLHFDSSAAFNNSVPSPKEAIVSQEDAMFSSVAEDQRPRSTTNTEKPGVCGCLTFKNEIRRLSIKFAEKIPDREFSMASLQGFLMQFKTTPHDAIEQIDAWITEERRKKVEREGPPSLAVDPKEQLVASSRVEKEAQLETLEERSAGKDDSRP